MGVMTCSRSDCENIMCDTYVPSVGYICSECQEEFKMNVALSYYVRLNSDSSIIRALQHFIEQDKNEYSNERSVDNVSKFLKEHTT